LCAKVLRIPRDGEPIGLNVTRTGRVLNRAFDDALAAVGGSSSMWLVATALKGGEHGRQRDIAAAIGVEDATLTHHLNRMERAGLVARRREPANRRNQVVELTADGEALFERMRATVVEFDRRIRRGMTAEELGQLATLLDRLRQNATAVVPGRDRDRPRATPP
jgi:MarR family transcriptional regulator, transcriptional regulator for hemolysin